MWGTKGRSRTIAFGGIFAALSLVMLYLACITPSGKVGLAAVAGLFPVGALLAAGKTAGYFSWLASGLLGLLMLPDKGIALLYLLFLGGYPVLKNNIEAKRKAPLEICAKLLYFNAVLLIMCFLFSGLFLAEGFSWMQDKPWLILLLGNLVFAVYDVGLTKLITVTLHRGRGGKNK